MSWHDLHKRFLALMEKTGASKITSYQLSVNFLPTGEICVYFGTYDIADWPRHTTIGPFKTEDEALAATEQKIIEAEKAVAKETAQ